MARVPRIYKGAGVKAAVYDRPLGVRTVIEGGRIGVVEVKLHTVRRLAAQGELRCVIVAAAGTRPRIERGELRIVDLVGPAGKSRCRRRLPGLLVEAGWETEGVKNVERIRFPESSIAAIAVEKLIHGLGGCRVYDRSIAGGALASAEVSVGARRSGKKIFPEGHGLDAGHIGPRNLVEGKGFCGLEVGHLGFHSQVSLL